MEKLQLHAFGQNDHIESLKKAYEKLKKKIKANENLTETEKSNAFKRLKKTFEKEKQNSNKNLY